MKRKEKKRRCRRIASLSIIS